MKCVSVLSTGQAQAEPLVTVIAFLERRAEKWLGKAKESITATNSFKYGQRFTVCKGEGFFSH